MHAGSVPASKASASQQKVTACQLGMVLSTSLPGCLRPLIQQRALTQHHTHCSLYMDWPKAVRFIRSMPSATHLEWLLCDCTSSFYGLLLPFRCCLYVPEPKSSAAEHRCSMPEHFLRIEAMHCRPPLQQALQNPTAGTSNHFSVQCRGLSELPAASSTSQAFGPHHHGCSCECSSQNPMYPPASKTDMLNSCNTDPGG